MKPILIVMSPMSRDSCAAVMPTPTTIVNAAASAVIRPRRVNMSEKLLVEGAGAP